MAHPMVIGKGFQLGGGRFERGEHGIDDLALFGGELRDGARAAGAVAAGEEVHRLVVFDAERLLRVGRGEVERGVDRNVLEDELLEALEPLFREERAAGVLSSFVRNVLPAFFSVSVLQFLDLTLAAVFSNHVLKESMSFRPALKLSAEAVKRPPYWKRRRSELAGSSVFVSASASLQPVADLMNAKASASIGSSLLW